MVNWLHWILRTNEVHFLEARVRNCQFIRSFIQQSQRNESNKSHPASYTLLLD